VNIKEYIESGILESYALGEVSDAERRDVEAALLQHQEVREELRKVEGSIEALAFRVAIAPPERLKGSIISRVTQNETKVVMLQPESSFWKYATAASVALALFASYMAFYYNQLWKADTQELAQLRADKQRIAEDYNVVNQKLDKIQSDLAVIESAAFTRVIMKGTANDISALASVYWNPNTKEVYLSVQQLKAISQGNQFQLWAIVNGKPVDAGVFDLNFAGLLKMKNIDGAAAFAVTIEPRGGKDAPTLDTMQVVGSVITKPS
jgi:anti-sigma-K factor RskA